VILGDIEAGIKTLSLAVQRYEDCGDVIHTGHALNDLGIAFSVAGRHDEAIDCHSRDLSICSGANDRHGAGKACVRIAENLITSDEENIEPARIALAHAKTLLDPSDTYSLADLAVIEGEIAYAANEHERGQEAMNYAIDFYDRANLHGDKVQIQLRHGNCLVKHGYPDLAVDVLNHTISSIGNDKIRLRASAEKLLARALRANADVTAEVPTTTSAKLPFPCTDNR
jgi:tetratricopeptide (TPR) repeat protein